MVWHIKASNGKTYYVNRNGNFVYLCKSPKGALNEMPSGWEVTETPNGSIRLIKS